MGGRRAGRAEGSGWGEGRAPLSSDPGAPGPRTRGPGPRARGLGVEPSQVHRANYIIHHAFDRAREAHAVLRPGWVGSPDVFAIIELAL